MKAKTLQICGTGSGVGKSIIVAGFCRIFLQDGFKVAPFKAQNMALNSFVTKEEGEIGRAQASQAAASRIEPSVDMNPILIKPTSDIGAQIIVRGRPIGNMRAAEYIKHKKNLRKVVKESFKRLSSRYDIVVIEGAGSPAEINLKKDDLVNMKMARLAKAPVILVGDIDRGGVFAWLVGTLELLSKDERAMIKGIIINKFRGDKALLLPAIKFLERRLRIKVLGIVPYFKDIIMAEEDSVSLDQRTASSKSNRIKKRIDIAVIKLPHISNFTDFDALERERDVLLRYVRSTEELNNPDLMIIPGTKNTISDLKYLRTSGLAEKIISRISSNSPAFLLGICGGYQMLGKKIYDKYHLESNSEEIQGLALLPMITYLAKDKVLNQVKAREVSSGIEISGYEIHHGLSDSKSCLKPFFEILERNSKKVKYFDGFRSKDNRISGTYIHGLFDADNFRREFLNKIRQRKGWEPVSQEINFNPDREFDKLAQLLRENIDMKSLYGIMKA
ncbi:MAG: cobyric acid synthase [Candidatus Omnitrophota bacterium]|nr:cobyric acid synthase [Candidatus Omnitrophota bacterium]